MGIKGMTGTAIPESYAGPKAWWDPALSKAVIVDTDMTGTEIIAKASLDWEVEKRPLRFDRLTAVPGEGNFYAEVPDLVAIVRATDDKYMGAVTPSYHLFQNREGADFMDKVLDEADGLHYHTGGSLYEGKIVWLLAKFDHDIHVRGDGSPIEGYLFGWWGHDGRHALNVLNTEVRVWCANTAQAAIDGARVKTSVRHTKNMGNRVEEVRRVLDINFKYREAFEVLMNDLALKPLSLADVKDFSAALWPVNPEVENPYNTLRKRDDLVRLYRTADNLDGVPETAYRLYQATVEYLDHHVDYRDTKKGEAADNRALSIIEGTTASTKDRALALLK